MNDEKSIRIMIQTQGSIAEYSDILESKPEADHNGFHLQFLKTSRTANIDGETAAVILTFVGSFVTGVSSGVISNAIYDLTKRLKGKHLSIEGKKLEISEREIKAMIAEIVNEHQHADSTKNQTLK